MTTKIIYLGAGHGGNDPGAVGFGHTEAKIATEFRDLLKARLTKLGWAVHTDGGPGENLPLKDSIAVAKTIDGPRLEFHLNAGPASAKGVEILSLPTYKKFAISVAQVISKTLGIPARGEKGWKSDDSGQHHRLGFCREAGGSIVELFFLSNKKELETYLAKKEVLADVLGAMLDSL